MEKSHQFGAERYISIIMQIYYVIFKYISIVNLRGLHFEMYIRSSTCMEREGFSHYILKWCMCHTIIPKG